MNIPFFLISRIGVAENCKFQRYEKKRAFRLLVLLFGVCVDSVEKLKIKIVRTCSKLVCIVFSFHGFLFIALLFCIRT